MVYGGDSQGAGDDGGCGWGSLFQILVRQLLSGLERKGHISVTDQRTRRTPPPRGGRVEGKLVTGPGERLGV